MPQLQDPNFRRAVLLMVQHDEASSFGLVLNRPADLPVSELFSGLEFSWHGRPQDTVSWGGPVELNSGWMLFGDARGGVEVGETARTEEPDDTVDTEEEVTPVAPGVYFAGSLDVFRDMAEAPPEAVRFFLGYSGWGPGQLEFEIAQGAWLSAPATPEAVFVTPPERMWDQVVRGLGIDPSTLVSTSGVH
jgi:putative transcriptional regulator